MWYVGLDWADTHHDVAVLDESGKPVGARRFSHSPRGLNDLKQFLWSFASHPEELACIVETNHGLLIAFLLSAGIPVYPVNPKTINGLRNVAGAKTDRIDAQLLAKAGYFRLSDLHRLEPDSPTVQELKTLTRDQDALVQMQTRLVNQLTACRKRILSGRAFVVLPIAPACHVAVFASLPDSRGRSRRVGGRDHGHLASRKVSQLHSGRCCDR
jgi:transposase